jgi:hypothetical protein
MQTLDFPSFNKIRINYSNTKCRIFKKDGPENEKPDKTKKLLVKKLRIYEKLWII